MELVALGFAASAAGCLATPWYTAASMEILGRFDWLVIGAYLLFVAAVAYYVAGRGVSTRDYFLGGRSLPWWAAALSIIATETSAVTFIGLPLEAFQGDWSLVQLAIGFALGRIFLAFVFVRVFYRRDYLTVYGFLAHRYGEKTRKAAAALFLCGRVVASGVRLYAGCLALQIASGVPIEWTILILGVFGTIFTSVGGIRAVVWTDVLLGATFVASAFFAIHFLLGAIPGGLAAVAENPLLSEKTRVFHWSLDIADSKSLLAGLLGGFVITMATHGTDQDIAQRMLTCRDSRAGSLSVLGSALLIVPLWILFLAIGTLLFFAHEAGAFPENIKDKELFPRFLASGLPGGIAGFAVAGLLAAALSSFTSALNALAATAIGDFYRTLRPRHDELHLYAASKVASVAAGVALVLTAFLFIGSGDTVLELGIKALTYFYGALLGAFLLGICTRRGTDGSVFLGMLVSAPVVLILQLSEYSREPENAPTLVRKALGLIPQTVFQLLESIPPIAFPYWIIAGTLTAMLVGMLRSEVILRR